MSSPGYLPFLPAQAKPGRALPPGTCDCHFHFFEDAGRHPYGEPRSYTPTPATQADYRHLRQTLGIDRAVLVHPSVYGRDHRSFEDALLDCGEWMRGVAVVYPDTPDADIARWHALGARGTRCNALFAGGADLSALPGIAARVRDLGWHLQLLIDVNQDPQQLGRIADLGLPVVVDHFGHTPAAKALGTPGFNNLLALVREGRAWVKLSGAYRVSAQRKGYDELAPVAEALWRANPGQLVWGTDWPHPSIAAPMADDTDWVDAMLEWFDDRQLQQILVDNPTRLYWAP